MSALLRKRATTASGRHVAMGQEETSHFGRLSKDDDRLPCYALDAVRCASAIAEAIRPLDIQVRSGLHAGEIEIVDSDVQGIAVHIASRVSALAGPGEVLVSRTVRDLVAGSGLRFNERGKHSLKGLQEPMDLYVASN